VKGGVIDHHSISMNATGDFIGKTWPPAKPGIRD
jgi:hypothetical protein